MGSHPQGPGSAARLTNWNLSKGGLKVIYQTKSLRWKLYTINRREAQIRGKLMLTHALKSIFPLPNTVQSDTDKKCRVGGGHTFIHSLTHLKNCQICARPCARPQELVAIKRHNTHQSVWLNGCVSTYEPGGPSQGICPG